MTSIPTASGKGTRACEIAEAEEDLRGEGPGPNRLRRNASESRVSSGLRRCSRSNDHRRRLPDARAMLWEQGPQAAEGGCSLSPTHVPDGSTSRGAPGRARHAQRGIAFRVFR